MGTHSITRLLDRAGLGRAAATLACVVAVLGSPRSTAAQATSTAAPDVIALLHGEPGGLTAEQVAQRALDTSPSLDGSRAALDQARAGAALAYLGFFPRLELTARYTRLSEITQGTLSGGSGLSQAQIDGLNALVASVSDPAARTLFDINVQQQIALANLRFPVLLNQFAIGGTLSYPLSDVFLTVLPSYEGAERAVDASRAQLRARASEIAQQAREAFYNYARARAAVEVARAAVATIQAQEVVVQANVDAQTVARVDLLSLQAQRARAEVAVLRAEGGLATAAEAIRTLMHDPELGVITIGEDVLAPMPERGSDISPLVAQAVEQRPEAEALRSILQARARSVEAAEGSRLPHLILQGALSFDNPSQRIFPQQERFVDTWSLSAILTWSPNDFFTGEAHASSARAQASQTEADLAAFEDALRLQVTQALTSYRAARASLAAAQAGIEAAEETVRVRTEQARLGTGLISDLLLATTGLAQAQLDLATAAIDARIADTQLARAIGADGPYEQAQ
jgi:outer membrane protein TolC